MNGAISRELKIPKFRGVFFAISLTHSIKDIFNRLLEKTKLFQEKSFKKCPMCSEIWPTRNEFIADSNLKVNGYISNFDNLKLGIFLFDHLLCKTTLAIQATQFTDMYKGPVYEKKLTGGEECPGYCLKQDELRPCPAECECAYIREVLNIVNN